MSDRGRAETLTREAVRVPPRPQYYSDTGLAVGLYRDPDLIGVFFTYYYPSQKGILKKKA